YRSSTLIAIKLAAVFAAWMLSSVPAFSALAIWRMLGGHLSAPETLNLLFGHLLYGLLVGAIALFAAAISESAATAAIIALAFTIGSWGFGFWLGRAAGSARVDFALVAHADVAELRAGTSFVKPLARHRRWNLRLYRAFCGMAASGPTASNQTHSVGHLCSHDRRPARVGHTNQNINRS